MCFNNNKKKGLGFIYVYSIVKLNSYLNNIRFVSVL